MNLEPYSLDSFRQLSVRESCVHSRQAWSADGAKVLPALVISSATARESLQYLGLFPGVLQQAIKRPE